VERRPRGLRVVRDVDVLPETVAHALGTSRRAAEVALWGPMNLARRCARVIAALKAAGDDEALVRFIQPIDQAIHAAQPAAVTDDMPCREPARSGATPVALKTGRTHGG
jgi:hypothetical protein